MFPLVAFGLYNYLLDSSRALTVGSCLRKIPDQLLNAAVLSGVSLPPSNRLSEGNDAADRVERIRCLVTNNTPSWEPPSAAITLICKNLRGVIFSLIENVNIRSSLQNHATVMHAHSGACIIIRTKIYMASISSEWENSASIGFTTEIICNYIAFSTQTMFSIPLWIDLFQKSKNDTV
jgi:hypothetical protein